jgi:hypothetical protein
LCPFVLLLEGVRNNFERSSEHYKGKWSEFLRGVALDDAWQNIPLNFACLFAIPQ